MTRLVGFPFEDTFTFTRPVAAPVRGEDGALSLAAVDQPRFEHDINGKRLGLLVGFLDTLGQTDRCAVVVGDWELEGDATVLHEYAADEGTVVRRAFYARNGTRTMVNAVLRANYIHRIIGAVPGLLPNKGGFVRYRERDWELQAALGTGEVDEQLGDGSGEDSDGGDRGLVEA